MLLPGSESRTIWAEPVPVPTEADERAELEAEIRKWRKHWGYEMNRARRSLNADPSMAQRELDRLLDRREYLYGPGA